MRVSVFKHRWSWWGIAAASALAGVIAGGLMASVAAAAPPPAEIRAGVFQNGYCGDGQCQPNLNESPATCPQDCGQNQGPVCGNNQCEPGEDCSSCRQDCGKCPAQAQCGDGACDAGEDAQSCPADCAPPAVCGDGVCNAGEDFQTCAADCTPPFQCGNGVCEAGEHASSCPIDCAPPTVPIPATAKAATPTAGLVPAVIAPTLTPTAGLVPAVIAPTPTITGTPGPLGAVEILTPIDQGGGDITPVVMGCGNGICEPPGETLLNCPGDCKATATVTPWALIAAAALLGMTVLGGLIYVAARRSGGK